jgi:hypothetical protein
VLNDHYRTDGAERLVREVVPVLRARLGETSPEMGNALDLLGSIRYIKGDYAESETLRLNALAIYRTRFGPRSPVVVVNRHGFEWLPMLGVPGIQRLCRDRTE